MIGIKQEWPKEPWVLGYGEGLTGPTTPPTCGVTVHETIAYNCWQNGGGEFPYRYHTVISYGTRTLAIIPTLPEDGILGHAVAERIVKCVNACAGISNKGLDKINKKFGWWKM